MSTNGSSKTGTKSRKALNSKNKLNVLIIAQYFPPDMGGGATRAYNAAKGLVLNGCKVTVVAAAPHYPHGNIPPKYRWKPLVIEHKENMKIIRTFMPPLPSKGLANRILLFASFIISSLFALPAVGKTDIIWAANPNILSFYPAFIYSLVKKAPVILNVDDPWPEDLYNFGLTKKESLLFKIGEILARIAYHKAKAITPISPGYIKIIAGRYKVPPDKIHIVRSGVDTTKFKPSHTKKTRNKDFTIIYSGAFSVAYDFDQILYAAKILQEKGENVQFILQGGGELTSHIKNGIKQLALKNVKILDKILTREEVAKLLSQADALILPLRNFGKPYLGISSKLYEYQALAKPIICCAIGQPAQYIKDTHSGIIVPPGKSEKLVEAIIYLKTHYDHAQKLGQNGRKTVEEKLDIKNIGLKLKTTFQNILS